MKLLLKRCWPALALLALTLIFFSRLAFSGLILARGDTYAYFYPYWAVRNAALMQGHLPLWSPDIFMGVPLLANPQPGTFYPPNWPLVPLSPPDGVRLSVLVHVYWALLGAYVLSRRWLNRALPALAAAAIFGLGGYVGAHVESVNQLQGLAWLPWLFLLYHRALDRPRRYVPLLAGALALQFLAGHTQTVFISVVGLGIFGLVNALGETRPLRRVVRSLFILALAGLLTAPLILPQLIPTMELTSVSNRSGGLNPNEATSFSFHPLIFGRGLLPSYDSLVFGEFVTYGGVIGLGLALVGLMISRRSALSRARWLWAVVMLVGLLMALGEFNGLYWQLAHLPGFNYFRVPARWLALFTLGMSLLAGIGLQALMENPRNLRWPHFAVILLVIGVLAAVSTLAAQAPQDVIGPAAPTAITWIGWALALVVLLALLIFGRYAGTRYTAATQKSSHLETSPPAPLSVNREEVKNGLQNQLKSPRHAWRGDLGVRWITPVFLAALLIELFLASRVLPYNLLVLPEAYSAQRFTISQLLAYDAEQTPPGRMLAISDLLFDPGDRAALEARYQRYGFSDLEVRISHIATKLKEIVAPNLPLVWNIPSIDGFDGGLLPSRYFTAFTKLMLPPDSLATLDGRLREILAREDCRGVCLPDSRWLNLTGTRYLVTDKVFDLWHEGIAFDTTFDMSMQAGDSLRLENPTDFEADAVDVLYSGDESPVVRFQNDLHAAPEDPVEVDGLQYVRWLADVPTAPDSIELSAERVVHVRAVTLVDTRTGDFAQLVPDPSWRRILSSDIKMYENQAVLPRAFVVQDTPRIVPDTDEGTATALQMMADSAFDPARTIILHRNVTSVSTPPAVLPPALPSAATVVEYTPERIVIDVQSEDRGYLLLTDAFYPGWQAQVNGEAVLITRADVMFRAVPVPAGASEVVFEYRPAWLPGALIAGAAAWIILFGMTFLLWRRD